MIWSVNFFSSHQLSLVRSTKTFLSDLEFVLNIIIYYTQFINLRRSMFSLIVIVIVKLL